MPDPMVTLQIQLPEEAFSALRRSPDDMVGDMRLAAAVHWYSRGLISQERAAQVAGLDRTDFLLALSREGMDVFAVDMTPAELVLSELPVAVERVRSALPHSQTQSGPARTKQDAWLSAVSDQLSARTPRS